MPALIPHRHLASGIFGIGNEPASLMNDGAKEKRAQYTI